MRDVERQALYDGDVMPTPPSEDKSAIPATAAVSWRDIYRAVAESEVRIVAAINSAVGPLSDTSRDHETRIRQIEIEHAKIGDHEARIRQIEIGGSQEAKEATAETAALAIRVGALEREENTLMSREHGILATLSAGQKTVLLLAAIVGITIGFIDIITRLAQ